MLKLDYNRKTFIIVSSVIFVILASVLVFTAINNGYYDLLITSKLSTVDGTYRFSTDPFVCVFKLLGVVPTYLILIFIFQYFVKLVDVTKFNKKVKVILKVIFTVCSVIFGYLLTNKMFKYVSFIFTQEIDCIWVPKISLASFIYLPIGIIVNIPFYFMVRKINFDNKQMCRFLFVSVILIAISLISMFVLKEISCRYRYREIMMLGNGDTSFFTPWYSKGAKGLEELGEVPTEFYSFPSGHTTASANLLIFVLMPFYFKELKGKKFIIIDVLIVLFILTVMFSRLMAGAHYLSDVVFSLALMIVSLVVVFLIESNIKKDYLKSVMD